MVAIFTTWIILSLVMFQQATRGVDTGATAAVPMAQPRSPTDARTAAAPKASLPTTSAPSQAASTTTPPETTPPETSAPTTTAPTTAAPATSVPEAARPTTAAPALAPTPTTAPTTAPAAPPAPPTVSGPADPPPTPAPAAPAPVAPLPTVLTPSAPTPTPTPGPTLALTSSVAKKDTLAANLLVGLTPAGTLTAMTVTEGGGDLVWTTAAGDYVFNAPNGKDTTVLTFTYVQNGIPVPGNTLTIWTG